MNTTSDITKIYNKVELQELARELGLEVTDDIQARILVENILEDLNTTGVPDNDDCSDLMWNFLIDAEVLDEDGNVLPQPAKVAISPRKADNAQIIIDASIQQKPPCYTYADSRSPECPRCKVFQSCMAEREKIRATMPCFGLLFDINDEQCKSCLEAGPCRIAISARQQV